MIYIAGNDIVEQEEVTPICFDIRNVESIYKTEKGEASVMMRSGDTFTVSMPYEQLKFKYQQAFMGLNIKNYGN